MKSHVFLAVFFNSMNLLQAQIILNEIMFDPMGSEHTDEFVEVVNQDNESVIDLSGWIISDGDGSDAITGAGGGTLLRPGQAGVILDPDYLLQSGTYDTLISDSALILTIDGSTFGSAGFSNSRAEPVILQNPQGIVIDSIRYRIEIRSGHSFERISADNSGWLESLVLHGTPGSMNSVSPAAIDGAVAGQYWEYDPESGVVVINVLVYNAGKNPLYPAKLLLYQDNGDSVLIEPEFVDAYSVPRMESGDSARIVLTWTFPGPGNYSLGVCLEVDQDEKTENNTAFFVLMQPYPEKQLIINEFLCRPMSGSAEWVELYNPHNSSVDLAGWFLADNSGQAVSISKNPLRILPNEYVLLSGSELTEIPPGITVCLLSDFPSLNNSEDTISLLDPTGAIIDSVVYDTDWQSIAGVSWERILWNGSSVNSDNWHVCTSFDGMTPGSPNSVSPMNAEGSRWIEVRPNPFCPDGDGKDEVALIHYSLPCDFADLTLCLFDAEGRRIRDLRTGQETGREGVVFWEGFDNAGRLVRTGLYILFLEALDHRSGTVFQYKTTLVFSGAAL